MYTTLNYHNPFQRLHAKHYITYPVNILTYDVHSIVIGGIGNSS